MILGLAHVALEVADLDASVRGLVERGWSVDVTERGWTVPAPAAVTYPATSTRMTFAVLRREGSVPVEVTQHDIGSGVYGSLDLTWSDRRERIEAVSCPALDQESAGRFWRAAGARTIGDLDRWCLSTPFRQESVELRVRVGSAASGRIDGVGGAALAFVSTDVDADIGMLAEAGATPLGPSAVVDIQGEVFHVAFLLSPGGVPVELLAPAKGGTRP